MNEIADHLPQPRRGSHGATAGSPTPRTHSGVYRQRRRSRPHVPPRHWARPAGPPGHDVRCSRPGPYARPPAARSHPVMDSLPCAVRVAPVAAAGRGDQPGALVLPCPWAGEAAGASNPGLAVLGDRGAGAGPHVPDRGDRRRAERSTMRRIPSRWRPARRRPEGRPSPSPPLARDTVNGGGAAWSVEIPPAVPAKLVPTAGLPVCGQGKRRQGADAVARPGGIPFGPRPGCPEIMRGGQPRWRPSR